MQLLSGDVHLPRTLYPFTFIPPKNMSSKAVILVTGGSGLVGSAIKHVIETEPVGSRFGKREGETWIFASSKDGNLM